MISQLNGQLLKDRNLYTFLTLFHIPKGHKVSIVNIFRLIKEHSPSQKAHLCFNTCFMFMLVLCSVLSNTGNTLSLRISHCR